MAQQPQIQFPASPPIDLPLWHRFLRTSDLLWLSREAGEALKFYGNRPQRGATTAAILYFLVETARLNAQDAAEYLR